MRPAGARGHMLSPMSDLPWTEAEGIRSAARHLARRALRAALWWLVAWPALTFFTNLGTILPVADRGGLPDAHGSIPFQFGMVMSLVAMAFGAPIGVILSKGTVRAAGFAGWAPSSMAAGALGQIGWAA